MRLLFNKTLVFVVLCAVGAQSALAQGKCREGTPTPNWQGCTLMATFPVTIGDGWTITVSGTNTGTEVVQFSWYGRPMVDGGFQPWFYVESGPAVGFSAPGLGSWLSSGETVTTSLVAPAGCDQNGQVCLNAPDPDAPERQVKIEVGYQADTLEALDGLSLPTVTVTGPPVVKAVTSATYDVGVAPGELITLWGDNLSPATGGTTWVDGKLPAQVEGWRVMIGGTNIKEQALSLLYVSPTQINLQLPTEQDGLFGGVTAEFWIEGPDGVKSAEFPYQIQQVAPVFFTFPDGGVIVTHLDGANSSQGAPGEIVTLWATGLGESIPATSAGTPAPSAPPLAQIRETVDVTVDGLSAEVLFAGKAPGFAGLDQINVRLPYTTDGRKVLAISHQATTSRFYITVGGQ
jgi:uncharacterized protein (TIGR03437 family)